MSLSNETTNDDRVESVARLIEEFAESQGLDVDPDADGPVTAASDMICNILHWVQSSTEGGKLDALKAVQCGIGHYVTEHYTSEVDPVGPEAEIKVSALCLGDLWEARTYDDPCITKLA